MHRSRVGAVLVDHPVENLDAAAQFWGGVQGSQPRPEPDAEEFLSLDPLPGGVILALQRTGAGTPGRVHLDIETDDIPAEVGRLTRLGASVVDDSGEHAIMSDPGGLIFCVVPVQTGADFEANATTWD